MRVANTRLTSAATTLFAIKYNASRPRSSKTANYCIPWTCNYPERSTSTTKCTSTYINCITRPFRARNCYATTRSMCAYHHRESSSMQCTNTWMDSWDDDLEKKIELNFLNAKIECHKIKLKLREQEFRAKQATPLNTDKKPPSPNRQPHGSQCLLGYAMTLLQLRQGHGLQPLANNSRWTCCLQESVSRFNLQRNLSVRLCKKCTAAGHECPNSTNCENGDHTNFASLTQEDQDILSN